MSRVKRCPKCGCERGYTKAVEIVSSIYGIDLRTGTADDEASYHEGCMRRGTGEVVYCEECGARICHLLEAIGPDEESMSAKTGKETRI